MGLIAFDMSEQASTANRILNESKWRAQRARSTAIRRATAGAKPWSPSIEICYRSERVWDGDWLVGLWDKEAQRFGFSTNWLEYYSATDEDVLEAAVASTAWG